MAIRALADAAPELQVVVSDSGDVLRITLPLNSRGDANGEPHRTGDGEPQLGNM